MPSQSVGELLKSKGTQLMQAPRGHVRFTGHDGADTLLNDLDGHPHAFILASIMDRQIKTEKVWEIPFLLKSRLGSFGINRLARLSLAEIRRLMTRPSPLHRYPQEMSLNFYEAIQLLVRQYAGDAAAIWSDRPSSADVVYRLLQFRGVGPKIATMATNILARDFKVVLSDYFSVDVSVDIHVKRVFARLGLISAHASNEQVIYRARALSPEFPGLLDLPAWEIGRKWCRPKRPNCRACYMAEFCPSATIFSHS